MFELSPEQPVNQFNHDITQPLNKGTAIQLIACTYYISVSLRPTWIGLDFLCNSEFSLIIILRWRHGKCLILTGKFRLTT